MSKLPMTAGGPHQLPVFHGLKFNLDWIMRPLFGVVLAAVAIGAIVAGSYWFAGITAVMTIAAMREWLRMTSGRVDLLDVVISGAALALAFFAVVAFRGQPVAWLILAIGALVIFLSARLRGAHPFWQATGVLYLGIPVAAIIALRIVPPHGAWLVAGFLLIVWSTDTGALIAGNLIGGARIAPALSPNKTWSGTLGGIVTAAIVEAIYVGVLGGDAALGAIYAVFVSGFAHGGDLFESWVKRRFQVKDSGGLIPGHGGVLDRVDSTLSAGLFVALLVFAFHLDPLFGAHP